MSGSEKKKPIVMDNEYWIRRWENRLIGFHMDHISPVLEKNVKTMVDGRSNIRILVPWCGKSWDMKWLADMGHTVIGVEVARQAIEEFFQEQSISFTSEPAPALEGTLFQSADKKIQIYCCDFFKISPEVVGYMDAVWDRGSMVAINVSDRARYAKVMQSVMSPSCRYLLAALQYDETKYPGPPHHLGDEAIHEAFGGAYTVTELGCENVLDEGQKVRWGLELLNEKTILITPKH